MSPRYRITILSIALTFGCVCLASRTAEPFKSGPASQYAHQSSDQVTVGAKVFDKPDDIAAAFGKKTDLLKYGVLPVLVVIENKRQKTLDLRDLQVRLVAADGRHVNSVDPGDVMALGGQGSNTGSRSQVPLPVPLPKKKNRLNTPEIADRAFAARMLPPGESASGFYYFEARAEQGDKIYLSGMTEMPSGNEVIYFEFPLGAN